MMGCYGDLTNNHPSLLFRLGLILQGGINMLSHKSEINNNFIPLLTKHHKKLKVLLNNKSESAKIKRCPNMCYIATKNILNHLEDTLPLV
jgi:hypothetical protein